MKSSSLFDSIIFVSAVKKIKKSLQNQSLQMNLLKKICYQKLNKIIRHKLQRRSKDSKNIYSTALRRTNSSFEQTKNGSRSLNFRNSRIFIQLLLLNYLELECVCVLENLQATLKDRVRTEQYVSRQKRIKQCNKYLCCIRLKG